MNANEVIESYVRDVARYLPRRKRNDVAFELRSLLSDELAAKAQAEGRAPDQAMAMDLLQGFGRPAEAAARYHQRPAVIDPADTHHFLIWALAGAVTVSALSVLDPARTPDSSSRVLKWLGVLVICFGLHGWWLRRRQPGELGWKPKRVKDVYQANRVVTLVLGLLTLIPFFMYLVPQGFADVLFLRSIPTGGLALDATFLDSPLRVVTLIALGLHTAVYAWVAAEGRWRRWTRWTFIAALLAIGLLLGAHAGLAGQDLVFVSTETNAVAGPIFGLIGALMELCAFYELYREWARITPAPALEGARA